MGKGDQRADGGREEGDRPASVSEQAVHPAERFRSKA